VSGVQRKKGTVHTYSTENTQEHRPYFIIIVKKGEKNQNPPCRSWRKRWEGGGQYKNLLIKNTFNQN